MRSWPNAAFGVVLAGLVAVSAEGREIRPTAAAFLDIDVDVRSAAMGGTGIGTPEGPQALYSNPAGLSLLRGQSGAVTHASWFQGLSVEWIGYGAQVGKTSGAGLGITFLRSDALERFDSFGNAEGEFRVYDAAVSAGFGQQLGQSLHLGAALKGVHQKVDDLSASGFAADLAATYEIGPGSVSLAAQNVGPDMKIDGESFPMPTQVVAGGSALLFRDRLLVSGAAAFPQNYYDDVRLGVEVRPVPSVSLRAGYRHILEQGADDQLTGFTYGAGFWVSSFRIDYAYQPFEDLGDTHRFGILLALDSAAKAVTPAGQSVQSTRIADTSPSVPEDQSREPAVSTPTSAAPAAAAATGGAAAAAASTDTKAAPATEPADYDGEFIVAAGTHRSRITALQELRLLRVGGLKGGDIEKLPDGRYRVVIKEFDSIEKAQKWIDDDGKKHGSLNFQILPR